MKVVLKFFRNNLLFNSQHGTQLLYVPSHHSQRLHNIYTTLIKLCHRPTL